MSAALSTPGRQATRYITCAEAVFWDFASHEDTDLAWGLHQLAQDMSAIVEAAMATGDVEAVEAASQRCVKANAIVTKIAQEADEGMLLAGEALMEAAKHMIDAEAARLTVEAKRS